MVMLDVVDYTSIESKENREVLRFIVDDRFIVNIYKRKNIRFKNKTEEDYVLALVESLKNSFTNGCGFFDITAILNFNKLKINKYIGSIDKFHCKKFKEMGDHTLNFLINESFKQLGLDLAFEIECSKITQDELPDPPDEPGFYGQVPSPLRFFDIFKRKKMK